MEDDRGDSELTERSPTQFFSSPRSFTKMALAWDDGEACNAIVLRSIASACTELCDQREAERWRKIGVNQN